MCSTKLYIAVIEDTKHSLNRTNVKEEKSKVQCMYIFYSELLMFLRFLMSGGIKRNTFFSFEVFT